MTDSRIAGEALRVDGVDLFEGTTAEFSLEPATRGAFLLARPKAKSSRFRLGLGRARSMKRFVACFRYEPFWMKPRVGAELSAVPRDTQWLLLELDSGKVALIAPLALAPFRAALEGKENKLEVVIDSGDPATLGSEALALYIAVGDDPYALVREGAAIVAERLGTRLRRDKPLPSFADDFGWCTWDAFYQEVSHDKVRVGLESFRQGGVEPRFLILDDGWQSVRASETGEKRLAAFPANEKFPGGLSATVKLAKGDYGVRTFLVWHAVHGYWGGIDGSALHEYGAHSALRWFSPEVLSHWPSANVDWWGAVAGRPAPERVGAFYDDYHRYLAAQGVDGVKVDNQASVEGLGHGLGGRVAYMQRTRDGLEASCRAHFDGRLINCMSCSSEMIYQTKDSSLTRSSTDFWPNDPSSHGLHVYTNATVGLWFGEFIHPDWDMFQSAHTAGPYHAAARAVSGSPLYVSDKPEAHDFELVKKLVLSDGSVLRAREVGLPTRDCLFADPLADDVLFKVWNHNEHGSVVGIFNARYRDGDNAISGSISPADVPGVADGDFALYLHRAKKLVRVPKSERIPLTLGSLEAEVATIVALDRGVAAIGLREKLNSGGAVQGAGWQGTKYALTLRDGGEFVVLSENRPRSLTLDGKPAAFEYSAPELSVTVECQGACRVELEF